MYFHGQSNSTKIDNKTRKDFDKLNKLQLIGRKMCLALNIIHFITRDAKYSEN